MAVEAKLLIAANGDRAQKEVKLVDYKLTLDRPYDYNTPTLAKPVETLVVTVSPDLDDVYFHKWYTEKNHEDVTLKTTILNEKGNEELLTIQFENAFVYALSNKIEKIKPKNAARRHLLTLSIKATKMTVKE